MADKYFMNNKKDQRSVLMIASQEILMDLKDGGKRVSNRNYELLKEIFGEENVKLVMFISYREPEEENMNVVRLHSYKNIIERGINIINGRLFIGKKNEVWVVDYVKEKNFDIIFLDRSLYGTLVCSLKRNCITSEIWTFVHNVESSYFRKKMRHKLFIKSFVCKKVRESEKSTFEYSDKIISLTNRDADLINTIYGKRVSFLIPTTFKDKFDPDKCAPHNWDNKELLFIGSMFEPNYDGIKWFCRNVMKELPEYTLKIVGKGFEKKKNELTAGRSNVEVIGTVDNLEQYYYADNVVVMPIFCGDGQKVKTAEAMMYGKIILASDEALEGYHVQNVKGILRCNSKDEFVNSIKDLQSKIVWENARNSVRCLFQDNYEFERTVAKCRIEFEI